MANTDVALVHPTTDSGVARAEARAYSCSCTPHSRRPDLQVGRRHRERGSALLEVALTLPLLLLVSVGIFEFGRAFQTWQVLTNAAREGARIAVLPNASTSTVETRVRSYMQAGQLSRYDSATISVDPNYRIPIGAANASASLVTVTYPFDFVVLNPVARLVTGSSQTGQSAISLTTSAAMRNESQF